MIEEAVNVWLVLLFMGWVLALIAWAAGGSRK